MMAQAQLLAMQHPVGQTFKCCNIHNDCKHRKGTMMLCNVLGCYIAIRFTMANHADLCIGTSCLAACRRQYLVLKLTTGTASTALLDKPQIGLRCIDSLLANKTWAPNNVTCCSFHRSRIALLWMIM